VRAGSSRGTAWRRLAAGFQPAVTAAAAGRFLSAWRQAHPLSAMRPAWALLYRDAHDERLDAWASRHDRDDDNIGIIGRGGGGGTACARCQDQNSQCPKNFHAETPSSDCQKSTQYPGRLVNREKHRRSDRRSMPNAHFQSISSDRKVTPYAEDKLMMFWACCCATKHFVFFFMTP
jgi:hypothetical protein